jgi:hypothetical protein
MCQVMICGEMWRAVRLGSVLNLILCTYVCICVCGLYVSGCVYTRMHVCMNVCVGTYLYTV